MSNSQVPIYTYRVFQIVKRISLRLVRSYGPNRVSIAHKFSANLKPLTLTMVVVCTYRSGLVGLSPMVRTRKATKFAIPRSTVKDN
jgi:hypothetical protein